MAVYTYTITHFDGIDLSAEAAIASIEFDVQQGPGQTQRYDSVLADVVGRSPGFVRGQPEPGVWRGRIFAADGEQASKDRIEEIFSPERGLVFLRWDDGAGGNWRVAVHTDGLDRESALIWTVTWTLPDALSESNAEKTSGSVYTAMSGGSKSGVLDNAGTRKARPTFTITPQAQRDQDRTSFKDCRYGFFVNRAPNAFSRTPVAFTDRSGSDDVINTAALVTAGDVDADGKDIRLYLNDGEVERWLSQMNSTNTRIWGLVDAPQVVELTAKSQLTAVSPANGESIEFEEGVSELSERGVLAVFLDNGVWELVSYSSRNEAEGKVENIQRAIWYGQAAALGNANRQVWGNVQISVIAMGKSGMDAAPAPDERKPAFHIDNSRNHEWQYLSQVNFPSQPERPAQWKPSLFVPEEDRNKAASLLGYSSSVGATFEDSVRRAGTQRAARLVLHLPQGVEAVGSGLEYSVQHRRWIRMRLLGRDAFGQEIELADHWDVDEPLSNNQTVTTDDELYELAANGVRAAVTGHAREDGETALAVASSDRFYQQFVLAQDPDIASIMAKIRKGAGDTVDARMEVRDSSAADPENANVIIQFPTLATGLIAESQTWQDFTLGSGPFRLQAGTYWLKIVPLSGSGTLYVAHGRPETPNKISQKNATIEVGKAMLFALIHPHGGPVQPEAELFNSGSLAWLDNMVIQLDDATPATPLIHRNSGDRPVSYPCEAVIKKGGVEQFRINVAWLNLGESLVIDTEAQTAKIVAGNWERPVSGLIVPADPNEWFALDPGNNTVVYEEAGMADTDMTVSWRDRRN